MKRYLLIDTLRGLAVVNMVLYHFIYDLVYLADINLPFFQTVFATIWQKAICMTFILIAGYCHRFSKNRKKRSLTLFCIQLFISVVTLLFLPQERILFGIIYLLWISDLLMLGLEKWKISPRVGFFCSILLFILCHGVQNIPVSHDYFAFLGIYSDAFYSADYFPILPWFFLYAAGYYGKDLWKEPKDISPNFFSFCGRHSLLIYLLHQPVAILILYIGGLL